jgi:dTDP-4-dehydrorhamnose 3,5-epimerase
VGEYLSGDNHRQLYVPVGFAHGFLVTSDAALFSYKCTEYYRPEFERAVRWDDPRIGIAWPDPGAPLECSAKDRAGVLLDALPAEVLPVAE